MIELSLTPDELKELLSKSADCEHTLRGMVKSRIIGMMYVTSLHCTSCGKVFKEVMLDVERSE